MYESIGKKKLHPVNRMAAMVVRSGGESCLLKSINREASAWGSPPRMIAFPYSKQADMTGKRFNRLEVIGLYNLKTNKGIPQRWVVRCDCGLYELRRRSTLERGHPMSATMCRRCVKLELLKRK